MSSFRTFLKSGHPGTLFASFLYFDFCFAIWVLNGAMAPFISESFGLTPQQKGFMISVPIMAGAIMRFPLGVLSQYIGRKNAALTEMGLIMLAMLYGYLMVDTFTDVIAMGVLLGIAGASFGVALSLGSGWFPAKNKGLAMGIAGAGNSGTVLAVLFAPPLATNYGWSTVYGFAALAMLLPFVVMVIFAKEPPDREKQTFREHISCLFEKDGWVFNLIYIVTFGGFIGLSSFLPTYFHDEFGVSKIEAGQLTMLAAIMGSGIRILGGYISDRWGGINMLTLVFALVMVSMIALGFAPLLWLTTIVFMFCFAALGAGNGALFQMVPLRWPLTTVVASSMIGEVGALGGSFIPNAMGISKQHTGSFTWGFLAFGVLALVVFVVLRISQKKWTQKWIDKGGKARTGQPVITDVPLMVPKLAEVAAPGYAAVSKRAGYRTILYPFGQSELTDKANQEAAYLAKISGAKLILVHVEDRFHDTLVHTTSSQWKAIREDWLKETEISMQEETTKLRALGVEDLESIVAEGDVAETIAFLANDRKADLILLASHKTSPLGQLLMGERTFKIFKSAPCPILRVVR